MRRMFAVGCFLWACNTGSSGSVGQPTSLAQVVGVASVSDCANGGVVFEHGVDSSGNGVLEADEVNGTTVVCHGANGSSCSVADNENGTKTITCEDGTNAIVSDGSAGADGKTCTVTDNGDGTATLVCTDGTQAIVATPFSGVLEGDYSIKNSLDVALIRNVTEINGDLIIGPNSNPTEIVLPDLEVVQGDFEGGSMFGVTTLSMPNLNEVGGWMSIGQTDLVDLSGLADLTSAGRLSVFGNASLTSLGLSSLASITGVDEMVSISDNPILAECEVDALADQLTSFGGTFTANNNDDPCSPDPCSGDICDKDCAQPSDYTCTPDISYMVQCTDNPSGTCGGGCFTCIEVADSSTLTPPSAFTAEAWVRWDNSDVTSVLFHKWNDNTDESWAVVRECGTTPCRLRFMISNTAGAGGDTFALTGNIINHGQWYHVSAVWDGSDIFLYVDGTQEATATWSAGLNDNATVLSVGGGVAGYAMTIDEVRISDVARYTTTFTPANEFISDADTMLLFKFDADSGAADSSANGNNGTLAASGATVVPE